MNLPTPPASRSANFFAWERRAYPRYRLQLPITVAVRSPDQAVLLERVSAMENISAGGIYFTLGADTGAPLPEGTELKIIFPLVEPTFHPARVYAHCRARVVRRDGPSGVAAQFEQVAFVREERETGLPVPLPT